MKTRSQQKLTVDLAIPFLFHVLEEKLIPTFI